MTEKTKTRSGVTVTGYRNDTLCDPCEIAHGGRNNEGSCVEGRFAGESQHLFPLLAKSVQCCM